MRFSIPFPEASDWRIDWRTTGASLPEGIVTERMRRRCEALAALPEYRGLPEVSRQVVFCAALLMDWGETGDLSPLQARENAGKVRNYLWRKYDLAGAPEKLQFREAVCQLIKYQGKPSQFRRIARRDGKYAETDFFVNSLAAHGILCPPFSNELLALLSMASGCPCPDFMTHARRCNCLDCPPAFPDDVTRHAYLNRRTFQAGTAVDDTCWGEVILMAGLPGTGKDTWIKKHIPDMPMISLDGIRLEINVKPTDEQTPVIALARQRAIQMMLDHQPFVWNATNISKGIRNKQLYLFKSYGAAVRIVYLETSCDEQYRRNRSRKAVVPENVITRMRSELVLPEIFEAQRVEYWSV